MEFSGNVFFLSSWSRACRLVSLSQAGKRTGERVHKIRMLKPWCSEWRSWTWAPRKSSGYLRSQDGVLTTEWVSLWEEAREQATSPCKWGHSKKATSWKPGRRAYPYTESKSTLNLNFPVSTTVTNKCLLFKPSHLWYSNCPNRLRQ